MIDFEFVSPTKLIFGKDSVKKLSKEIADRNFKNILIVYGSSRIEKDGLLDAVIEQISYAEASYFVLKDIRPNPLISKVIEGVELCKKNNVDLILAIGGGSPIDTAKSIACGYYYEGNPFDFNLHLASPKKALPVGVILTIASAGSETSNSCVIQDDNLKIKAGFNSDIVRPIFAIEDPQLTFGAKGFQLAVGVADTVMHSLERYFNASDEYALSDQFALAVIKNTMKSGEKSLQNPNDYEARANLMLSSSLSHNGLTSIGKTGGFVVHPIEHGLSGYKPDIVHGAGVALIYPAWAEYVFKLDLHKFSSLTKEVFNKIGETEEKTAIIGIDSFREFFSRIGMPTSLADVGLTKDDIPAIANLVTDNGTRVIGRYPKSLNKEDIEQILLKLS